jgi:hypothetical protein
LERQRDAASAPSRTELREPHKGMKYHGIAV